MFEAKRKALKVLKNENLDPSERHGLDLAKLLPLFLKKDFKLDEEEFESLSLDLANDKIDGLYSRYNECAHRYDANFYFVLCINHNKSKMGLCLLGFKVVERSFLIVQIQGISFHKFAYLKEEKTMELARKILSSLKWERLLIRIAEEWAKKVGFRSIGILKAKHNRYFEKDSYDKLIIERNNRLKMHYDVTAQRMGYREKRFSRYLQKHL